LNVKQPNKNMKNLKLVIFLAISVFLFISSLFVLGGNKGALVGGDKDAHGCLGSAGYSWCGARGACIRPWEEYCTATAGKTVTFACDASKSITATFYIGDDKFVDLKLSDGRNISVPHAISASGARYAKPDESFVFWNKGDTAFITEGDPNIQTFSNCILK
jgi:membrane-bound inhibitor of C-type lysozyme